MEYDETDFSLRLFGLSSGSSLDELKRKYRELIKKYHPDTHPERPEWSTRMVQLLNEAYRDLIARLDRTPQPPSSPDEAVRATAPEAAIDFRTAIADGDAALRDAVVLGFLKRTPREDSAQALIRRIEIALKRLALIAAEKTPAAGDESLPPEIEFFTNLFSVFLEATVRKPPRSFSGTGNPTRYQRHLASANKYLDSGIRDYYHYRDSKKLKNLGNIPFSFLEDSVKDFRILAPDSDDRATKRLISARIRLARLFQARIRDAV